MIVEVPTEPTGGTISVTPDGGEVSPLTLHLNGDGSIRAVSSLSTASAADDETQRRFDGLRTRIVWHNAMKAADPGADIVTGDVLPGSDFRARIRAFMSEDGLGYYVGQTDAGAYFVIRQASGQ